MRKKQYGYLVIIGIILGGINVLVLSNRFLGFSIRSPDMLVKILSVLIPIISICAFCIYGYFIVYASSIYEDKIEKAETREDILTEMRNSKKRNPFLKNIFKKLENQIEMIDKKKEALSEIERKIGTENKIYQEGVESVETYILNNIKRILLHAIILTPKDYGDDEKEKFHHIIEDNNQALEYLQEMLEKVIEIADKDDEKYLQSMESINEALENFLTMNGRKNYEKF